MREIGEENVHRAQIYLTARLHTCLSCDIFVCIISRRDGENIGIAGVPPPAFFLASGLAPKFPSPFLSNVCHAGYEFRHCITIAYNHGLFSEYYTVALCFCVEFLGMSGKFICL